MKSIKLAAFALFTLMAPAAWADDTLAIEDVKAFATAATAMSGGGFMQITNTGATDDVLIGVEADFPRVQLHTTEFKDEVASMMHVEAVPIPAGETVTFEPGGLHVMFMGLRGAPLEAGESFPATLIFENAGEVSVTFEVVDRDMDHSN